MNARSESTFGCCPSSFGSNDRPGLTLYPGQLVDVYVGAK